MGSRGRRLSSRSTAAKERHDVGVSRGRGSRCGAGCCRWRWSRAKDVGQKIVRLLGRTGRTGAGRSVVCREFVAE